MNDVDQIRLLIKLGLANLVTLWLVGMGVLFLVVWAVT